MSENIMKLEKSLKWKFNNYLTDNDKLKFIINLALNSRFSDIYITPWKLVQYKKNWIITLTSNLIPNSLGFESVITEQDFELFLECIFPSENDITLLKNVLNDSKSFDYWVWFKFLHIKQWETIETLENVRLRLNFVNTIDGIMLTIRPLLNLWLNFDKLTSLQWSINYWKKLMTIKNNDTVKDSDKLAALSQLEKMDTISKIIKSDFSRNSWLILVTWTTWEWKSTLVTSLLEDLIEKTDKHIITLEDPIEYIFKPEKWKVTQIEIWTHIETFSAWIKGSKRENPDVVYIQEIRDEQSAKALLELLWSWVLVITTLHTWSVSETIDRLIWLMSDSNNQDHVRTYISRQLISIINQKLIYVKHKIKWKEKIITKWIQEYLHLNWQSRTAIKDNTINQLESTLVDSQPPNKSITKILWNFYLLWIISMTDLLWNVTNLWSLESLLADQKSSIRADDLEELFNYYGVDSLEKLK